ncbi:MAG TPA: DUF1501 domain-containing protein, partial [Pirellulales bacterium]
MLDRRDLLRRSSLIALAPTVPGFLQRLARAAEEKKDDRILVVVQLDGGNDGVNTVVPYRDEGYAKHRDKLRLNVANLHKLSDDVALHPTMRAAADLVESGRLAIVQGVGYPNPNRSHDVSMAIWHTARFDRADHKSYGWIGRALDEAPPSNSASAMLVGDGALPGALVARRSIAASFSRLDELAIQNPAAREHSDTRGDEAGDGLADFVRRATLDAYTTADRVTAAAGRERGKASYPSSELAQHLAMVARLIEADMPTRVYYAVHRGYDTHAVQLSTQGRLLRELSEALKAFLDDLKTAGLDDRVLVLCFSEFGRRVAENASQGTDHGTAGPVFLAGSRVRAGLHGATPNLADLVGGDLRMSLDFRQVYAAILR